MKQTTGTDNVPMSFRGFTKTPNWIINDEKVLTYSDKLVLLVLSSCAYGKDIVWPSQVYISDKSALNRRTVRKSLTRLVALGLIAEVSRDNRNKATYRLIEDIPTWLQMPTDLAPNAQVTWLQMPTDLAPNAQVTWLQMPTNNTNVTNTKLITDSAKNEVTSAAEVPLSPEGASESRHATSTSAQDKKTPALGARSAERIRP